jgi:hypothetical protein
MSQKTTDTPAMVRLPYEPDIRITYRAGDRAMEAQVPAALVATLMPDGTVQVALYGAPDVLHLVATSVLQSLEQNQHLIPAAQCLERARVHGIPCQAHQSRFPHLYYPDGTRRET